MYIYNVRNISCGGVGRHDVVVTATLSRPVTIIWHWDTHEHTAYNITTRKHHKNTTGPAVRTRPGLARSPDPDLGRPRSGQVSLPPVPGRRLTLRPPSAPYREQNRGSTPTNEPHTSAATLGTLVRAAPCTCLTSTPRLYNVRCTSVRLVRDREHNMTAAPVIWKRCELCRKHASATIESARPPGGTAW